MLVAAASAFTPAPFGARTHTATRLFSDVGKYDGKVWDNDGTFAGQIRPILGLATVVGAP